MFESLIMGAFEAVKGVDSTKTFVVKAGRAGTFDEKLIGYPDANAYGLDIIFTKLSNLFQ